MIDARAVGAALAAGEPATSASRPVQTRAASRLRYRRLDSMSPLRPPSSVESELVAVMLRVLVALLEHILYVAAGFGELDVVERQARPAPSIHVLWTGVIR